jgi:hypothetical protein
LKAVLLVAVFAAAIAGWQRNLKSSIPEAGALVEVARSIAVGGLAALNGWKALLTASLAAVSPSS